MSSSNGWTDVNDALPEPSDKKKLHLYSPTTLGVTTGFYWGKISETDPCKGWSMMGVTHWRPLLEPPENDKL